MIKFTLENVEYELPEYSFQLNDEDKIQFRIEEGQLKGIEFQLNNLQMDDKEEGLLHYDVLVSDESQLETLYPIVEKLILKILLDSTKYLQVS